MINKEFKSSIEKIKNMRKIKLIISFLLLVFSIVACTKENAHLKISIKEITNCLTDSENQITEKDSAFSYHATTSELTIHKYNCFYSCDGEINISAEIKDNVITIIEQSNLKKECTCPKNITYTIENIPSGSYKISINGKIIGEILMY